jgi:hypothetical protein
MKKAISVLLLSLMLILIGTNQTKVDDEFLISNYKVGKIDLGLSVDSLYSRYDKKNTKLVDLFLEGMFAPAIELYIDGYKEKIKPSLIAEISNVKFSIYRISIYDKRFKTNENIGVGSTLGDIRKTYEIKSIGFGESALYVSVKNFKIYFRLDYNTQIPKEWYKTNNHKLIPDSAKVISIGI